MIEFGKLLVDFGLVVLVLIVQLAIYPSFKYFSLADLKKWHPIYTKRFSIIVMPLMLIQLAYSIFYVFLNPTIYTIGNLGLVLLIWTITFVKAIPLHGSIAECVNHKDIVDGLVKWNLYRSILWIVVFVWSVYIITV